jgi:transcription elongation GreA/GreB family factor
LVGPDEFDLAEGYISMDSPLGRAVMGKAIGGTITVPAPDGERAYQLVGVRYT